MNDHSSELCGHPFFPRSHQWSNLTGAALWYLPELETTASNMGRKTSAPRPTRLSWKLQTGNVISWGLWQL